MEATRRVAPTGAPAGGSKFTIVGLHNISIDFWFNLCDMSEWSILPKKKASNPIYEKRAACEFEWPKGSICHPTFVV